MALDASIQESVVNTVSQQLSEAVEGFSRAFGFPCDMEVLDAKTDEFQTAKAALDVEGLAMVMNFGDQGFLFVIMQQDGLLPEWCKNPDASGESRLATLSQELGMTLIPDDYMPEDFSAKYVSSIANGCKAVGLAESFSRVDFTLSADGITTKAFLAWPVAQTSGLKETHVEEVPSPSSEASVAPVPTATSPMAAAVHPAQDLTAGLHQLPKFTRSLLQIQIPMSVRVVSTMKPIGKLLEIGPGSILQFEKNCEEPLILEANNEPIAEGVAVRAGDKFGIQLTKILMPRERFWTVQPGKNAG